jgi:prenylcysteine alpha-carboxyl methylesterase
MYHLLGGAWIIGYKAWGSLFGKVLSQCDVIVVTPDYRNFPQGFVSDMVEDATAAIKWVFQNISQHGGDVNDIYLCGQSAGAHISATLLINKAMEEVTMDKKALARTWKVNHTIL